MPPTYPTNAVADLPDMFTPGKPDGNGRIVFDVRDDVADANNDWMPAKYRRNVTWWIPDSAFAKPFTVYPLRTS